MGSAAAGPPVVSEVIRVRDQYYILATSALADDRTRVLKQGDTFVVLDRHGDVRRLGRGEQGLYHEGTRFLSRSVLRVAGERPLLLASAVTEDNIQLSVDLTTPDITVGDTFVPRGALHIFRTLFLWEAACYQRLRLINYTDTTVEIDVSITFETDFADIFEVRGMQRDRRGSLLEPEADTDELVLGYRGLDDVERRTHVVASGAAILPDGDEGSEVRFEVELEPRSPRELYVVTACGTPDASPVTYQRAISGLRGLKGRLVAEDCLIRSSNERFDAWVDRSLSDLRMMVTQTEHGLYPYAGVPWFSVPFGRDGIITAYQMLWVNPNLARGVLAYLAATQAREVDPERESEPGKIVHEQRSGEMARLGEVPFASYYGSVDATPLFVALAGEYLQHTGDLEFIRTIWPNVLAALDWIDAYGDVDGDGFVEYRGSAGKGLVQQGWKDSHDSVFHADGTTAVGPIALCEVQGYVYWAKRRAATLADALGEAERAETLRKQAGVLREEFNRAFWSEELQTFALALDGDKKRCEVRTSNAGQCLLSGIVDDDRAATVADGLRGDDMFTGWGIRTLADSEPRYGPITYHNGSVWPHDNALVADGLARSGHTEDVDRIFRGLLDASTQFDLYRLPELFAGFPRREGQPPVEYPLACAPQAWASGAVFLLLRACLGLELDAVAGRVQLTNPYLPSFLQQLEISGLRVGSASVDLIFHRYPDDVVVHVARRTGDVEVVTVK